VWQDFRSGSNCDIYGAKIDTSGTVIDSFSVSTQPDDQISPALTKGEGDQLFITYSSWADSINDHPANTMRIWGKFYGSTIIEETRDTELAARYRLQVHPNPFSKLTKISFGKGHGAMSIKLKIYDVSGRMVKDFPLPIAYSILPTFFWYGEDDSGKKLPQGSLLYKIDR